MGIWNFFICDGRDSNNLNATQMSVAGDGLRLPNRCLLPMGADAKEVLLRYPAKSAPDEAGLFSADR